MNIPTPKYGVNFLVDTFGTIKNKNEEIPVRRFTWRNSNDVQVQLITYGATITSVKFPNKFGCSHDVLLGFDDLQSYIDNREFQLGSVVCESVLKKNDISKMAKNETKLLNDVNKHLDNVVWHDFVEGKKVVLSYSLEEKNSVIPVAFVASITFKLNEFNEFIIDYKCSCTHMTITNMTHSCFFNLAGHYGGFSETIKHSFKLIGNMYNFFISGPKCFREPVYLKEFIDRSDNSEKIYTVSKKSKSKRCFLVATLAHEASRRIIEIYSNQNGVKVDLGYNFPKSIIENRIKFDGNSIKSYEPKLETFKLVNILYNKVKKLDEIKKETFKEVNDLIEHIRDTKYFNYLVKNHESIPSISATSYEQIATELSPIQMIYLKAFLDITKDYNDKPEINFLRDKFSWLVTSNQPSQINLPLCKMSVNKHPKMFVPGKMSAKYYKYSGISVKPMRNFEITLAENKSNIKSKPRNIYNHIVKYKFCC